PEPAIGIRSRHLCLSARLQSIKINLRPRALGHERRNLLPDIRAIPAAIGAARRRRLRRIVAIKRGSIGLNVALQRRYLLPQLLAGRNARLAGVTVEERPVDRHKRSTHQIKRARQQHEIAVRRLQRCPVLLPERADRAVTRRQPLQQPNHLQIAPRLPLQTARRPHPIEIAVKIKLQQIGRIVRRLSHCRSPARMAEPELDQIERRNIALDRSHRVIGSNVVLNPSRQNTSLLPVYTGLECAIRHTPNRTSTRQNLLFLPSLAAKPITSPRERWVSLRSTHPTIHFHFFGTLKYRKSG